jgi:hypothetical protein
MLRPLRATAAEGFRRTRMVPVAGAKAETVRAFLAGHVEPGSTVVTDGLPPPRPSSPATATGASPAPRGNCRACIG